MGFDKEGIVDVGIPLQLDFEEAILNYKDRIKLLFVLSVFEVFLSARSLLMP